MFFSRIFYEIFAGTTLIGFSSHLSTVSMIIYYLLFYLSIFSVLVETVIFESDVLGIS